MDAAASDARFVFPTREFAMRRFFLADLATVALVALASGAFLNVDETQAALISPVSEAQSVNASINVNPAGGGNCNFGGFLTTHVAAVRTSGGNWNLMCHFFGLPEIDHTEKLEGWECRISLGDKTVSTHDTRWMRTPSGNASLQCRVRE